MKGKAIQLEIYEIQKLRVFRPHWALPTAAPSGWQAGKEGLTEKVTSEERPEGGKGQSRSDNCEKSSPGTGNSKNKELEVFLGPQGIWCFSLKKGLGGG